MDPRHSAQDVHRCDLCETATVHSYCDFCHVNLCKPCVVDHISDGYDKHKIVPFNERRSTIIYPKCGTHLQEDCKFQCKDCNNSFVCAFCIASEQHRGHIFVEVLEVYKTKKDAIEKDTDKFENSIIPKNEEIASDLENQIANLEGGYEKLTTEISKQGEQWHREIDIIITKMKTEICEIKVKHRDILQKHLYEIKEIQSLISRTLLTMKEIKESTEVSATIEYSSEIRKFRKHPLKVKVSMPIFIPKQIDREQLERLFGQITPLSTATEENESSPNQPSTSLGKLLDEPELVTTIQTGYENLLSVTCRNEDRIWLSGKTSDIKCFNIDGSLHETININSDEWCKGIAVDINGDLIYCMRKAKTVNIVKNGEAEELITLQGWKPSKLCVTSTGDLLVTMYSDDETESKVVRYSGSTEKQTIQFDNESKHLYSGNRNIKYITENRNTDICVADWKAGAVVVVNQDGELKWKYHGHPLLPTNKRFQPFGVTTDSESRILTADRNNHCIHILNQNGQFLRYIDNCNISNPYGLCVTKNGDLLVSEYFKGILKKINYSN